MNLNRLLVLAGVACFVWSGYALSDQRAPELDACPFPDEPDIVSGANASEDEMIATGAAVQSYAHDMQEVLACLEGVEAQLGDDITAEQAAVITASYNHGVDLLNEVAGNYNEQVRAFRGED